MALVQVYQWTPTTPLGYINDELAQLIARANENEARHKVRWVSAGDMEGGATREHYAERYAVWSLADAVDTSRCAGQTDVPSWWGAGNVTITAYFASGTASTNPFRIRLIAGGITPGEGLAVGDISEDVDIAGPSVVDGLVAHTFVTPLPLVATDRLMFARLLRLGAHANDTHAAAVKVLGVLFTMA